MSKKSSNSWFDIIKYNISKRKKFEKIEHTEKLLRAKKVRIKPTAKQRKILLEWFKIYNYAYNDTIKYLRKNVFINSKTKLRDKMRKEIFSDTFKQRIKN